MPLPNAPSKRAALLTQKDFELSATARPRHKSPRGSKTADSGLAPLADAKVTALASPASLAPATPATKVLAPVAAPVMAIEAAPDKAVTRPAQRTKTSRKVKTGPSKLFVLDTNVLLHDPTCP